MKAPEERAEQVITDWFARHGDLSEDCKILKGIIAAAIREAVEEAVAKERERLADACEEPIRIDGK